VVYGHVNDVEHGWSTPKTLAIALLITLVVMFVGNGVCNELLGLGVPTWVFSGISGLLMFPAVARWRGVGRALRAGG